VNLLFHCLLSWVYANPFLILCMGLEFNHAVNLGKERIISAATHIRPGVYLSTALPYYNGAGMYRFSAETFYAEPFGLTITTAMCTAAAFLVCH